MVTYLAAFSLARPQLWIPRCKKSIFVFEGPVLADIDGKAIKFPCIHFEDCYIHYQTPEWDFCLISYNKHEVAMQFWLLLIYIPS